MANILPHDFLIANNTKTSVPIPFVLPRCCGLLSRTVATVTVPPHTTTSSYAQLFSRYGTQALDSPLLHAHPNTKCLRQYRVTVAGGPTADITVITINSRYPLVISNTRQEPISLVLKAARLFCRLQQSVVIPAGKQLSIANTSAAVEHALTLLKSKYTHTQVRNVLTIQ